VFKATLDYVADTSEEKAKLLIKKEVLCEDTELARLRREVLAMERLSTSDSSAKRTAIPEIVKMIVFQRDQGRCVRCEAQENLHFDHIIPVSKGGSNSEENIQLLCESCNLKKSGKIMS
jgi:5-methylcytosine-specific restriction endonuclease McrA